MDPTDRTFRLDVLFERMQATYMRYIALTLLLLVGCGGTDAVNYDVRIGALDPARCTGYMQLVDDTGYWRCEFIGGEAHLDLTTPGVVFLNLETTPGFFSQVRGVFEGDAISGQIQIDGDSVAFMAVPQAGQ